MTMRCPGQDRRFWKPGDIFDAPCPHCGGMIEFWKDDVTVRCPHCRQTAPNPRFDPGCAAWCDYATKCLGEVASVYKQQPTVIRDRLEVEARKQLINHKDALDYTLKAARIAERISQEEKADPLVVIASCLLQKVGLPRCEGADPSPDCLRRESVATARQIMERIDLDPAVVEQVSRIIENLPDGNLNTLNYQVVRDANRMLTFGPEIAGKEIPEARNLIQKNFLTKSGRLLAEERFLKTDVPLANKAAG